MDVNYNVTYGNENELKCTGNINSENETGNESEKHEEESLKKDQAKLSEIRELGNTNMTGPDQSIQILPIIIIRFKMSYIRTARIVIRNIRRIIRKRISCICILMAVITLSLPT